MHVRSLSLLLLAAPVVFATACGGGRGDSRAGVRPRIPADTGVIVSSDAGFFQPDATVVFDSGATPPDAGFRPDSGAPPVDAGFPRDSGFPDAGQVGARVVTIYDLQNEASPGHPFPDELVEVRNVAVTAVVGIGTDLGTFWIQEFAGGPYGGILVYRPPTSTAPQVTLGDFVTVRGLFREYFDVTELVLDSVVSRASGAPPAPLDVPASALADGSGSAEIYEGLLVRVQNAVVLDSNPDAPQDFGEFSVTGGLRIDDMMYRIEPRPLPGEVAAYVIGIHHHSFMHYKVLPRSATDVGPIR